MKNLLKRSMFTIISFYLIVGMPIALAQTDPNGTTTNPGGTDGTTTNPDGTNGTTTNPGDTNGTTTNPGDTTDDDDDIDNNTPGDNNGTDNDNNNDDDDLNNGNDNAEDDDNEVDNTIDWAEVLTYGGGGALLGSLLTYFALKDNRRTI